jgi:acid phosphatase (class A)
MEKLESKSPRVIELSQSEFEGWSKLSSSGEVRHLAYDATLNESHEIAADRARGDVDLYRRELGQLTEIPAQRVVDRSESWNPEFMALSREPGADRLAAFRQNAPPIAELARWEAFQSPADRLPLDAVKGAITDAEAAKGKLAGNYAEQGYYAGFNYYVPNEEIRIEDALPPPPQKGSSEQAADLEAVRTAGGKRTEERTMRVQADANMSVFRFADVLGKDFNADSMPVTTDILRQAFIDGDNAVNRLKSTYDRPRPFIVDTGIKPIVEQPPNASYPSGHSTFAHLNARLLARALPEHADALAARAEEYASNRVIAGVHFPTDIEGGRRSAEVIDATLMADPVFAADFARATREMRTVMNLPPFKPNDDQALVSPHRAAMPADKEYRR